MSFMSFAPVKRTICRAAFGFMMLAILGLSHSLRAEEPRTPELKELLGLPLVLKEDFESGKMERWVPTAAEGWMLTEQGKNHVFSQFKHIATPTPVRSPHNRAILKDVIVSDCVLDLKLQSTARDYPHRSLCLFFGYQDPSHFYYVHFGQKADDHANQIFIVNAEPRKKISTVSTDGTPWDDKWHHARVVRKVESGSIDIYFDNMDKPVMQATDKTFAWGQVGIGSFDDTGNFDDVMVFGKQVVKPTADK